MRTCMMFSQGLRRRRGTEGVKMGRVVEVFSF